MRGRDGDLLEAAALAVDHLDELVVGTTRDVHLAVSDRVHGVLGAARVPAMTRPVHDGIARGVYAGVGGGLRWTAHGLRFAGRAGVDGRLEDSATGRFVISAVNGLIGDRLVAEGSMLAIDTAARRYGRDVALTPPGVWAAFPHPTDALVVFVHGLCETEHYWDRSSRPRREGAEAMPSYGRRLERDEGWTAIDLRVNTGVPIAESGVAVRAVVARLLDAWPVPVRRIALVGHSMGGLIVRAACGVRTDAETDWTHLVSDIVTLGTPHLGSPVERGIARAVRLGERLPEVAPVTGILGRRSRGVLDLHDGMPEIDRPLPGARVRLVGATLGRRTGTLSSGTVGDGLVPFRSAIGRPLHGEPLFPGAEVLHLPRAGHFDLLNHDDVYAALRRWLAHAPTKETA